MNKLSKFFRALSIMIKRPYLLNLLLENSDFYRKQAEKNYYLPYGLPQININDIFPDFKTTIEPLAFLDGSSSPMDFALLKMLAIKFEVQDYLEIGTWRGESVANLASVVKNCYTLNLPDEDILKLGYSEDYVNSHRFFSKDLPNVKHIFADSHNYDFGSLEKKFDMVFIDGDHHYEGVKKDTKNVFEIIKSEKSIIIWHDYASSPETIRWDVMMGILDGCPPNKRQNLFHVSNTLCAVYLNNNSYPSKWLKTYKLPDKHFKVSIEANSYDK